MMPSKTLALCTLLLVSFLAVVLGCETHTHAKQIIQREKCLECHTIKGKGGSVGPNLTNVGARRSRDYIIQQIKDPKSHNVDTQMPSFNNLPDQDLKDLVDYLTSLK